MTEALKDIEWLTMPLIDKRLAGELGKRTLEIIETCGDLNKPKRFLCFETMRVGTFPGVKTRFRQAKAKVDKPHQEFPFCMTHLEPKHL